MRNSLQPGTTHTAEFSVDAARTIAFMGDALRVYATPSMCLDIEQTCRKLLLEHHDPGEDSVGTGISVTHGGATLLGMSVEITVTVKAVDGRKVAFDLVARDGAEEVSRGEHGRFVVEVEKLRARVAAKAAQARGS